jgi:hypothetical protein
MKSKFTIGARLSLVLSLTIASFLAASGSHAESGPEQQAKKDLSRTITELVGLGADRQWLVVAALERIQTNTVRGRRQNDIMGASASRVHRQNTVTVDNSDQLSPGMTQVNDSRQSNRSRR